MADVVGSVLAVNFVQGPDYLQDVAVSKAEAENAAARAKQSELNALGSANKAKQSEIKATYEAEQARRYAVSAEASAVLAANYADDAQESADSAKDSANDAGNRVNQTAILIKEAENIAAGIFAAGVPAWESTKVYSYNDVVSYYDGNTYRCIGRNVPAGTIPAHSPESWVRISVLGGDDFFDIDVDGDLIPGLNPTFSYDWQLDANGDIMPWAAVD